MRSDSVISGLNATCLGLARVARLNVALLVRRVCRDDEGFYARDQLEMALSPCEQRRSSLKRGV